MGSQLLVAVWSVLFLAININGHPVAAPEESNSNFVPGVFISNEALKDLQEKAQQNQINTQTPQPITNERKPITNTINPSITNENREQLKIGAASTPISSVSIVSQTQPILSQPAASQPILSNQPISSQPIVSSQQIVPQNPPQIFTPQVIRNQQPNQAYLLTQPTGQPMLVQQPSYQQPILVNQPGTQMLTNQQPANQLYVSQTPSNQVFLNQAGNQMPPNSQVLLQNGQIAQIIPQPYTNQPMLSNNVGNNQVAQNPRTNIPSGTTLYAMVPVSGPSRLTVPNTNLGSGNSYLVPVQQQPANRVYTISVK